MIYARRSGLHQRGLPISANKLRLWERGCATQLINQLAYSNEHPIALYASYMNSSLSMAGRTRIAFKIIRRQTTRLHLQMSTLARQ